MPDLYDYSSLSSWVCSQCIQLEYVTGTHENQMCEPDKLKLKLRAWFMQQLIT